MEISEVKNYLTNLLEDRISYEKIYTCEKLIKALHEMIGLDYLQVCEIINKCPFLLKIKSDVIIKNIKKVGNVYNLRMPEIKNLILKLPYLVLVRDEVVKYKVELVSVLYGVTNREALRLIYIYPELMFISKEDVIDSVKMLCKELNEYDIIVKKHFRKEPLLVYAKKEVLVDVKKYLMKNFSFSEDEVNFIIKKVPALAITPVKELSEKLSKYYPAYFIKRDIREILLNCPEFINLKTNNVFEKIEEIKNYFSISLKNACEFVRVVPNILFFNSPKQKLDEYKKINISSAYILSNPKICGMPMLVLKMKFEITRILGIENIFNKICEIPTEMLLSRFLFMQDFGYYKHADLTLNEELFQERYKLSSQQLKVKYKINEQILLNINKMFEDVTKQKIFKRKEISILSDFINSSLNYKTPSFYEFLSLRNDVFENDSFVNRSLNDLGLDHNEACLVLKKNSSINGIAKFDCFKIIDMLKKYGFCQEEIVWMLINKSDLFVYKIKDFDIVVNEVSNYENCDYKQSILAFM